MDDRRGEEWSVNADAGEPTEPIPAATVVLVRSVRRQRQVLLLKRPADSVFAPDAWVFPGGRVDAEDYGFDHAALAVGPDPDEWARRLAIGSAHEAAAYVVAAIREAWEETGIPLVDRLPDEESCDRGRLDLLAGTRSLDDILRGGDLRLATARLSYIAHWITPDWLPRRFDTRFFLSEVDPGIRCTLPEGELVEHRWLAPDAALQAERKGEMILLPPTVDTLQRLHRGEL